MHIIQLNIYIYIYPLSPECFDAYCTILREKFVSLTQNYVFYTFVTLVVLQNIKYFICKLYNVIYNH